MTTPHVFRSLRVRILATVLVCAVAPLAGVGIWLTQTAARSGALLLQSQLDSTADRAAVAARERWAHRQSDVLLLAGNEPVRIALAAEPEVVEAPSYLERAFSSASDVVGAEVRDARGRVRWTLGMVPTVRSSARGDSGSGASGASPFLSLRAPVRNDTNGAPLGEVVGYVRMDALVPALARTQAPDADFIAVLDRATDAWISPASLAPALLDARQFVWEGRQWLAVRRSLDAPTIDIVVAARLDTFVAPFARNAAVGAGALGAVAVGVVVLTLLVTTRLTGSLTRLAEAADAVARGDFDRRVDVEVDANAPDEVGRVARTFNTMTSSIRRMMRELSQREAVAAMGELAATVAHQVRSPATAMRIDVQRAHDKLPASSLERALLARALEQMDRLERAVAGSLKLARGGGAAFAPTDLRTSVVRAVAGLRSDCARLGVTLDDSGVAAAPIVVLGDAPALEQLLANVLVNAIQAAGPAGCVWVTADSGAEDRAVVIVRDNGPGMTAEVLARAGEPLFSTKAEGTGLGLAIAHRIAAAHRGSLVIESVGAGTTVRLELPLAPVEPEMPQGR